ncbi:hypothetical protein MNEG_8352 [Monoraphidium neglectum]|uniref:Uncharacterized protein n=1 Tax=Monoraphidium neglectum TaxID=145388 RepID=A0A0D2JK07_9CHLO|nr:hypothetical protein MNEG_8352 [Monoraphidium neglectum]KIY99607.1 hypothetical protein MNEG_8352 [Monoraphidium neglectum]|eukprot:XP_013898627.1 hypothetical protein MNEG_8352 [Monoraphidium neglectum]
MRQVENAVYVKNLKSAKKLTTGESGCPDVRTGEIMRQSVAVITTGIGQDAAAMCVYEVLTRCGHLLYNAQSAALFGQCSFQGASAAAGLPLSDELLAAAAKGLASPAVPPRPARLLAEEAAFWAAMADGTKAKYPALSPTAAPKLWSYNECMEISSQYFWSGAPWDMVARKYVADTLNAANRTTGKPARAYTQGDVIAAGP